MECLKLLSMSGSSAEAMKTQIMLMDYSIVTFCLYMSKRLLTTYLFLKLCSKIELCKALVVLSSMNRNFVSLMKGYRERLSFLLPETTKSQSGLLKLNCLTALLQWLANWRDSQLWQATLERMEFKKFLKSFTASKTFLTRKEKELKIL